MVYLRKYHNSVTQEENNLRNLGGPTGRPLLGFDFAPPPPPSYTVKKVLLQILRQPNWIMFYYSLFIQKMKKTSAAVGSICENNDQISNFSHL